MAKYLVSFKRRGRPEQNIEIRSKIRKEDYILALRNVGIKPKVVIVKRR